MKAWRQEIHASDQPAPKRGNEIEITNLEASEPTFNTDKINISA